MHGGRRTAVGRERGYSVHRFRDFLWYGWRRERMQLHAVQPVQIVRGQGRRQQSHRYQVNEITQCSSVRFHIYIYYTGSKPLQLDTTFYTLGENPFGHKLLWGVCPDRLDEFPLCLSTTDQRPSLKNHIIRVDSVEKIPCTPLQFRHGPNFYHNTSTDCRRPFNNGTQHGFRGYHTSRFSLYHMTTD